MNRDRTFADDLDDDAADEEVDGTELASIDWQEIHYSGPASSMNGGIQLIKVRSDLARSVPYGDIEMGLLAESVELDAKSPEAACPQQELKAEPPGVRGNGGHIRVRWQACV